MQDHVSEFCVYISNASTAENEDMNWLHVHNYWVTLTIASVLSVVQLSTGHDIVKRKLLTVSCKQLLCY